ncbi:MAG: imidazole glycerol phosphate synthase subunit HisH [bacterium]
MKVFVVDYKVGNLYNLCRALRHVGLDPVISSDKKEIMSADALILPGVGAFGEAMDNLHKMDLVGPIKNYVSMGKPFIGVCLGMQLLFTESHEFSVCKGLNILEGSVLRFPNVNDKGLKVKVPQISWNNIYKKDESKWQNSPLKDTNNGAYVYFVHSYYVKPDKEDVILSETVYEGVKYCSSIMKDNIYAFQFHPERSGLTGLKIINNFKEIIYKK